MENKDLAAIRKSLNHLAMKWAPSAWLDTGVPGLNAVLGHETKGLAYGRMTEISGWESNGKTACVMSLAALAQQDGALVVWGDVENSFEPDWAKQRGFAPCPKCSGTGTIAGKDCADCGGPDSAICGLDPSKLILIQPYVGRFSYTDKMGKMHQEKEPRLSTAQELCSEIEAAMSLGTGVKKRFVVLDSIAALLTEGESNAGVENANMRTNMDLPMFMGRLLRRWIGLAQVHNAMIILVNQLRQGPKSFGDPTYTPGGNAPRFYSHVRVRVHRVSGSKITDKGKTIGIKGILTCKKNKTGGSEGAEIGFRLMFKGPLEFVPVKDVKGED
jgi:RecA/RadA recombinase